MTTSARADEAQLIAAIEKLRKLEDTRRKVAGWFLVAILAGLGASSLGYFKSQGALEAKKAEFATLAAAVSSKKEEVRVLEDEIAKLKERRLKHVEQVAQFIQTRPEGDLTEKDLLLLRDESDSTDSDGAISAASLWTQGYEAAQIGDLERAEADFRGALKVDPQYAPALNSLGVMFLNAGKLEDAAKMFEDALAARQWYATAASNLGKTRVRQGRFADAMLACATAKRLEPDSSHLTGLVASLRMYDLDCSQEGAAERYGKMAAEEFQIRQNVPEAIRLFKLSCQYGYARACNRLATLCSDGNRSACPEN